MKLMIVLAALALLVLTSGVCFAADPPKCPPDKVTIEKYCKANHKDRADECVVNLAKVECKILKQAVAKADENPDPNKSIMSDCVKAYMKLGGGSEIAGFFGCGFWLSIR